MAGDSAADERVFIELKNAYSSGKHFHFGVRT
jgi:hypothetical protein